MSEIDYEKENQCIAKIKDKMNQFSVSYEEIKEYLKMDISLMNWYLARRKSLLLGTLDDELISFYQDKKFTFGRHLYIWNDWCVELGKYLRQNNLYQIDKNICLEDSYFLGKWAARQIVNFRNLSVDRKIQFAETKIEFIWFYPRPHKIIYNGKEYESFGKAIIENNFSVHYVFEEVSKMRTLDEIAPDLGIKIYTFSEYYQKEQKEKEQEQEKQEKKLSVVPDVPAVKIGKKGSSITLDMTPYAIKSLVQSIDLEKMRAKIREDEKKEKAEIEEKKRKVNENSRKILLHGDPVCIVDEFMEMATSSYKESILESKSYPVISKFNRENFKKYFQKDLVDWNVERGGFYLEGEEYISLSAIEINQSVEPFFLDTNIAYVRKSVQELREGKGTAHELIEVEDE